MKSEKGGDFGVFHCSKILGIVLLSCCATPAFAQPANDSFANRIPIAVDQASVSGTLSNATFEAGEPIIEGVSSGQTAWWTWTAPSNGIMTLEIDGTGFNPLLAVYQGSELPNLSLVASNIFLSCYEDTECGCHWRERTGVRFHVAQGAVYQIGVDSAVITDSGWEYQTGVGGGLENQVVHTTNVLAGGAVQLTLHFQPAPQNDDLAHAILLSGKRKHINTSNAGATREAGEPLHLGNPSGSSVWYSWKAPASGRVTLSANEIEQYAEPVTYSTFGFSLSSLSVIVGSGSGSFCGDEIDQSPPPKFYPVFAAYTGSSVDSLVSANALELGLEDYPHAVSFDAVRGTTYQIAFDGNAGTTGNTPLYLALTKPASNDAFKHRLKMHGARTIATGYNAGATHEANEPAAPANSTGKSVWWSWTAPVNGLVWINLDGSDYESSPVSVFTGSKLKNLTTVPSITRTNSPGYTSFEAVAGHTYQIATYDLNGLTGKIKMSLWAEAVETPLVNQMNLGQTLSILRFNALPKQKILLQHLKGESWKNVRTAVAHQRTVNFMVRPAAGEGAGNYRAVVVDYIR
ncbi:MAG TPA: hypothetical protein VFW05_05680 [Verrucomicrobiae bacterium]|nr:hypothetical protein [Verrucomicrobiae bacterium]